MARHLIPKLNDGFYCTDYADPVMSLFYMPKMIGMPEYMATVKNHLSMEMRVTLCQIIAPDSRQWWADTITGTLYDVAGKCQSGPLQFLCEPVLTGRTVKKHKPTDNSEQRKYFNSQFSSPAPEEDWLVRQLAKQAEEYIWEEHVFDQPTPAYGALI